MLNSLLNLQQRKIRLTGLKDSLISYGFASQRDGIADSVSMSWRHEDVSARIDL